MMDQQSFEATRPVSADPAVALAEALGQLPKEPVKAPAARPHIVAKTSVEELAQELGLSSATRTG
jgi:DNA topoisomerase-1